jgi:hypothetical protein
MDPATHLWAWFLVTAALELTAAPGGSRGGALPARGRRPHPQTALGDGRMPRLDEGAAPAPLPGPTGRRETAASAARPPRSGLGGWSLVAQAGVASMVMPELSWDHPVTPLKSSWLSAGLPLTLRLHTDNSISRKLDTHQTQPHDSTLPKVSCWRSLIA